MLNYTKINIRSKVSARNLSPDISGDEFQLNDKIEYDTIASRVGLTKLLADKYIKLIEVFGFSTKLLKFVNLQTLFELCKAKYATVVEQMRNRTDLDEMLVCQLINEL